MSGSAASTRLVTVVRRLARCCPVPPTAVGGVAARRRRLSTVAGDQTTSETSTTTNDIDPLPRPHVCNSFIPPTRLVAWHSGSMGGATIGPGGDMTPPLSDAGGT